MSINENIFKIKELLYSPVNKTMEDVLSVYRGKRNVIYGAGSFGREMLSLFQKNNVKIEAFLDQKAQEIGSINNIQIYSLDNFNFEKENVNVFFSIVCDKNVRKNIISDIKRSGFKNIVEAQSIRCQYICFSDGYCKEDAYNKIQNVFHKFEDEKSKKIFLANIIAHLSRNYSNCGIYEDSMSEQYFPEDIDPEKGYSCCIDCGGFIGDTVEAFMKKHNPECIVSFEPSIENFNKLSETCSRYEKNNTKFILFNNAVSNDVFQTRFISGTGSGTVSENGDLVINAVSVDKVISGINPTFIKMDIEGEEINALLGCRKTIEKYAPDLAICVYHNIDHIWEIPYLINKMNSNYCFYLRSYNSYTMETVLYAYEKKEKKNDKH